MRIVKSDIIIIIIYSTHQPPIYIGFSIDAQIFVQNARLEYINQLQ